MSFGLGSTLKQKAVHFAVRKMASWGLKDIYGATWSRDSRSLALSIAGQLHLFDVATGTFARLASPGDFSLSPTFSPDGTTLAYYAGTLRGERFHWEIWLHNLATGKERTLPAYHVELPAKLVTPLLLQTDFTLSWHPDGYRLACTHLRLAEEDDYSVERDDYFVEIIDVADNHTVSLHNPSQRQRYPVWSPDGQHLSYAVEAKAPVISCENGVCRLPSEAEIAAIKDAEDHKVDLYVADSEGKHSRKIWNSKGEAGLWRFAESSWKADSSGLIALTGNFDPDIGSFHSKPETLQLHFAPLEGTPNQVFSFPSGVAAVSPDLQAVVYLDEYLENFFFSPAPFAKPRILDVLPFATLQDIPTQPLFSPDGKTVAVLPVEAKPKALHVYDVESGRKSVHPLPR